jgi:hypothetical protein
MKLKAAFAMTWLLATAGCSSDTSLKGVFEKQMKQDRVDGFNIIHLQENETNGLVLYTAWTKDYPENKNQPGIHYYEKGDSGWESRPGMGCSDSGVSRLGLMGKGYLYCAMLKDYMQFSKVMLGDIEALIFQVNEKQQVWYALSGDRDAKVVGVSSDGKEVALN